MKYLLVDLPPWTWAGTVLAGGSYTDFVKVARKAGADISAIGNARGHAYLESDKPWLLWVETLDDLPTVAHEAFHIVAGVLEGRGLFLADASEEAYAYTLSSLLHQIWSAKKSAWKVVK